MGSAARTVNLPLHGGKSYTPLCRHAQHFFSHSAAFTKYISKCRLFPYGLRNRARFLSRQRTAIPPWHITVGRLFCWESPYWLRQYGLLVALFRFRSIRALVALFRFRSIRAPSTAMCSGRGPCAHTPPPPTPDPAPTGRGTDPLPLSRIAFQSPATAGFVKGFNSTVSTLLYGDIMKILLDFDGTLTNIEQEYEFECRYIMSELKREFGLDEETINALFDVAKAHVADNACEHGWCDNDRISAYCDEDLFMTVASTMTLLDKWLAAADERADVLRKHGVAGATPMMDLTQRAHAAINAEPLSAFNTPEPVVVKAIHELLERDCEVVVVSNSPAERIIDKFEFVGLKPVDHLDNPSARFRIRGHAKKFCLGDNPLPVEFGSRCVDIDRPYYADILRKERPQVVVGDVFSLDLALPIEMARREPMVYEDMQMYLRTRSYTPQWAIDCALNPPADAPVTVRLLNHFTDLPMLIHKR